MGLEDLRMEILRRTFEEVKKVDAEAAQEKSKITSAAEDERKRLLESTKAEAEKLAREEHDERLAAARLDAMRVRADAMESAMGKGLVLVWKEFAATRKSKSYPAFLKSLVMQGVREVGKDATVSVRKEDQKLVKEWGINLAPAPAEIEGGAIIASSDGRVTVRNTLRDIFERHRDEARRAAYSIMYAKKPKPANITKPAKEVKEEKKEKVVKPMKTTKEVTRSKKPKG